MSNLIHEAAALYGFVDFISRFSVEQESSKVYGASSEEFFRYVRNLASTTQKYLESKTAGSRRRRIWAEQDRSRLALFKECWNDLHELVKPAADGHALQTPSPLLTLMQEELREIRGLESSRIVILVSPTLNYLQYGHSTLQTNLGSLSSTIPNAPQFPPGLGFIQIPYSQGLSVLTSQGLRP